MSTTEGEYQRRNQAGHLERQPRQLEEQQQQQAGVGAAVAISIAELVAPIVLHVGTEEAKKVGIFLQGLVKVRVDNRKLLFLELPRWIRAARKQLNADGTSLSKGQMHEYVKTLFRVWVDDLKEDVQSSYMNMLITQGLAEESADVKQIFAQRVINRVLEIIGKIKN